MHHPPPPLHLISRTRTCVQSQSEDDPMEQPNVFVYTSLLAFFFLLAFDRRTEPSLSASESHQ